MTVQIPPPAQIVTRKRRATLSGYEKTPISAIIVVTVVHDALERVIAAISFCEEVVLYCTTQLCAEQCAQFSRKDLTIVTGQSTSTQDHWQTAIQLAKHDWVFLLQDDEVIDYEAATTVQVLEWYNHTRAWRIARHLHVGAQEIRYGGWSDNDQIRLFHRSSANLQSDLLIPRIIVSGDVQLLPGALHRHALRDIADIIPTLAKYPAIYGWSSHGHTTSQLALIMRGLMEFLSRYMIRFGWRDGYSGLILALAAVVTGTLVCLRPERTTGKFDRVT
jgi:hypothetical protein